MSWGIGSFSKIPSYKEFALFFDVHDKNRILINLLVFCFFALLLFVKAEEPNIKKYNIILLFNLLYNNYELFIINIW